MICNPSKCKEIIFRKKGFIQDIAQVNNIPQCTELPILGVTFQENCKYSELVRAKLIKANKCLFVLRSLRKEGFSQGEVDLLVSALVLPNFTYGMVDPDCPLSNIIPKKKETKYLLRNKSAHRPDIKTDRFKNVFVNRIIFRYNL